MRMHDNTIFITGGTSGIGRGLAEAFHKLGNQVIISGRREDRLKDICGRNPGMRYFVLDVTDAGAIQETTRQVVSEFPAINCVFNNAGVQMRISFAPGNTLDDQAIQHEIYANLLGPIRVAAAFLPHLAKTSGATLVNVSSGLAFVPAARFPVYCATKAAIHAWTLSIREQLKGSGIKAVEIIPPYVATELGGADRAAPPPGAPIGVMSVDAFIAEAMQGLESGADEIAVGDAKKLVAAACLDNVKKVFSAINS